MNSIIKRRSIRTYDGEKLTNTHKQQIIEYIENDVNLVGIHGNIVKIRLHESVSSIGGKIGTYGMIKNAPAFLIVICKNTQDWMLDCGYVFEKLVLFLENLGLGTCWLGGTFSREQLTFDEKLGEGYFIPIISPVGYEASKLPLKERIIRKSISADNKKVLDTLFFNGDFASQIKNKADREHLEMVRLAPSASNKQPWRVVMQGDIAHFYIMRTPNYGKSAKLQFDIQWLDIGIALAHYEIASKKSTFTAKNPDIAVPSDLYEYVISVQ